MAEMALHRTGRYGAIEHAARGVALGDVALLGGGAVAGHVADVGGRVAGFVDRDLHRAAPPFLFPIPCFVPILFASAPFYLRLYSSPPCLFLFVFFFPLFSPPFPF